MLNKLAKFLTDLLLSPKIVERKRLYGMLPAFIWRWAVIRDKRNWVVRQVPGGSILLRS